MDKLAIVGIIGGLLSPIITMLGLYLQHKRELITTESESDKRKSEAQKVDMEVLASYATIVTDLRNQVDSLIELGKANASEIAMLKSQLAAAITDKYKLEQDKAELLREIQELREEINVLRTQLEVAKHGTTKIT
jgi:chromosome segregation ATPase